MRRYSTLLLSVVVMMLLLTGASSAQESLDDPEVDNIRARVIDVSMQMKNNTFADNTYLEISVQLELWNPYNTKLTSYGSSSCPWDVTITANISQSYNFVNRPCTADYGPRDYPSGLSNESATYTMGYFDRSVNTVPEGTYYINAGPANYSTTDELYYGVEVEVTGEEITKSFENLPDNWGDVYLSTSSSTLEIPTSSEEQMTLHIILPLIATAMLVVPIRKYLQ